MLSKPLAAVQSATSISGVSGNGAVSRPSLIGRASVPTGSGARTTSTQRPSRALSAMASLTSISSWPSAKVG